MNNTYGIVWSTVEAYDDDELEFDSNESVDFIRAIIERGDVNNERTEAKDVHLD